VFKLAMFCTFGNFSVRGEAVEFDIPSVIPYAEVADAHEVGEGRIVEISIPISADIAEIGKVASLRYEVECLDGVVLDFLPKTTFHASNDGQLVETSETLTDEFKIEIGGSLGAQYTRIGTDAKSATSTTKSTTVSTKLLPPRKAVLASGTKERGGSLFYQLQPSTQWTLQGVKNFGVLLQIPSDKTHLVFLVRCHAKILDYSGEIMESMAVCAYPLGRLEAEVHAKEHSFGAQQALRVRDGVTGLRSLEGEWAWKFGEKDLSLMFESNGICVIRGITPDFSAGWFKGWDGSCVGEWGIVGGKLSISTSKALFSQMTLSGSGLSLEPKDRPGKEYKRVLIDHERIKYFDGERVELENGAPLRRDQ